MSERLYLRQLLSGTDFARTDPLAQQMVNFAYLVGDREAGECMIVDPAYAVDDLVAAAAADGMRVTGVLVSHYHPDHVGGTMMGHSITGVADLLERHDVAVHVQRAEAPFVKRTTGLTDDVLELHDSGDVVEIGEIRVELVHTPGHTPGSQCFLVSNHLVTGDTLFIDGCGRTDLPGGDASAMVDTLRMLARLPEHTVVCPGHRYSVPATATMGDVVRNNYIYGGLGR